MPRMAGYCPYQHDGCDVRTPVYGYIHGGVCKRQARKLAKSRGNWAAERGSAVLRRGVRTRDARAEWVAWKTSSAPDVEWASGLGGPEGFAEGIPKYGNRFFVAFRKKTGVVSKGVLGW